MASLYYPQPILHTIAGAFHASSGTAGLIVTLSQIGYAVGLGLLVPAGDIVSRRRLVPIVLLLTAMAMVASAVAPSIAVLIALALIVGLGTVMAQVLVPLAASLATDESRGRVVGTVMSGLLLGILLARTVSGLVAGVTSWRTVYVVGAVLLVLLSAVLARVLPPEEVRPSIGYRSLLSSTVRLFLSEPLLRRRAVFGGLGFAAFSVFWTTSAFLLAGAPYHYNDTVIGLFGLVGAGGALCANFAGRLADRNLTRQTTAVFAGLVLVSFVPMWLGRHNLAWLIAGIFLLDVGVQGMQVTNQSLIYRLAPDSRSRVNASYMVCYFAGGAIGSALAAALYESDGWAGVCLLGAALGAAALVLSGLDARFGVAPGRDGSDAGLQRQPSAGLQQQPDGRPQPQAAGGTAPRPEGASD
ncbi:MFS transporter [Acidiferrimicrobium sp. IK]|uniref:MFS transporter n=1 Tax=Acidiferrimicrobium sp. IK TaxID=2871700 RepID=UPI0021CAF83B|nr:MFS transporter [Acidiferrimicrobium sp. IK]MCU4185449.1 MFS transporter [Acidiferrimicrobium sp. IK]